MVLPPTIFISGGMAVLHLCNEVYTRLLAVKRYRKDCEKLARFVQRIEAFITETEADTDMTAPGWQSAFSGLHDALLEVVAVFEGVASYGMIRSLINADELNLRLNSISQRLMLALQLIPIQKAKATDKRLIELQAMQAEIRTATFAAVHAAEEQSAALKRLMDQSRVDASKTQDMLAQVLMLLQSDPTRCAAASAAGSTPGSEGDATPHGPLVIDPDQLHAELADLHAELEVAVRNKNVTEEDYLEQMIAAISAMEQQLQQLQAPQQESVPQPPVDLLCPITLKLLEDPVILVDSAHTYERVAIQEWLDRGNRKDPVSGIQLTSTTIVPNIAIRKMAQDWAQAHPAYKQQQDDEASRTTASSAQQQQHPPAAASDTSTEQGGNPQEQLAVGDCCFSINPKTAAILAAGEQAGFSSSFDPSKLAGWSAEGASSSGNADEQDKQQAQQAYARAVAAAAAAESAAVVAMPAVGWGLGNGRASRQDSAGSSIDGSRCSSITFARAGSNQTLPRLPAARHASPADSRAPAGTSSDISLWPAAQASAVGPGRQHSPRQQSPLRQQSPRQQQQRQQSPLRQHSPRQSPRGFTMQSSRTRQERAAAASAAAAAVLAAQQQRGGFNLRALHGTLDRAADSRYAMTNRLRGPEAAGAVRETAQQLRQEREVQRQQGVQEEERLYLQQHMERLMRDQSPLQQRQRRASNVSTSSGPPSAGWETNHVTASHYPASDPGGSSLSMHSTAAAPQQQYPSWPEPSAPHAPSLHSYYQSPGEADAQLSAQPGLRSPGSAAQPRPIEQLPPPPAGGMQHSTSSTSSFLGRFRRGGGQAGADAAPSSQCDDTASVSSYGSTSSRRSLRGLLGGAAKNLKYAMVYDDTKV